MKFLQKSVALLAINTLILPGLLSGAVARVVAEDPDGAEITRAGTSMSIAGGDLLMEGDVLLSNSSTLVVSICDGALVTIYPDSEVVVSSLSEEMAVIDLVKGEILGDTISGCAVSIANKAGTADISNGVFGVLMDQTGDGWTLQVRNLNGEVSFTGSPSMDSGNVTASIVEADGLFPIPQSSELTLRGTYNPDDESFVLVPGGAALSGLPDEAAENMIIVSENHNTIRQQGGGAPAGEQSDEGGAPASMPDIIEIPFDDIDTASDKG